MNGLHHLLIYDYVDDIVERRAPHREGHLGYAQRFKDEGKLVAGGATGDPPSGAILVFKVDDPGEVEAFADGDPYVREGLVTARRVEPWNVVI
jgi:uncharacterized protein YciI